MQPIFAGLILPSQGHATTICIHNSRTHTQLWDMDVAYMHTEHNIMIFIFMTFILKTKTKLSAIKPLK